MRAEIDGFHLGDMTVKCRQLHSLNDIDRREMHREREQILTTLRSHKKDLSAKYGVTRLGIFGSTAHDEATGISDVDIIVEMPPDLFQMVHMKEELEELLLSSVDLIRYHKHLNPLLRKRIDRDAIYV
jgi:uncharacterized protein